ncbi:MAG: hypothetical protein N2258_03560 [Brevinematales bacterium]|nr:hypothetical protein [Brevinematales bacterium]
MKKIILLFVFSIAFGIELPEYSELLYVKNFKSLRFEFQKYYMNSIDQKYSDFLFDYLFFLNTSFYADIEDFSKEVNSPVFNILKDVFYIVKTKDGIIFLIEFQDTKGSQLINELLKVANAKGMKGAYYVSVYDNLLVISKNKNLSYNFKRIAKKPSKQLIEAFDSKSDIVIAKRGNEILDKSIDELIINKPEKSSLFFGKQIPEATFCWNLKTKKFTFYISPASKKESEYIEKDLAKGFPSDFMIFFHLAKNPYLFFSAISSSEVMNNFEKDFKANFYNQIVFGYRVKEKKGNFLISMKMKENFYKNSEYFMQNFVENFVSLTNLRDKSWVIKKYKNSRIYQNQKNEVAFYIREPYVYLASDIKLIVELINTLEGNKKTILDTFSFGDVKDFYINNIGVFRFNFESFSSEFLFSMKDYTTIYPEDVEEYSKWLKSLGAISGKGVLDKDFDKYEFYIR